jgi:hypothetical protein
MDGAALVIKGTHVHMLVHSADSLHGGDSSRRKDKFVPLDSRERDFRFRVADRLWRLQRQRVEYCPCRSTLPPRKNTTGNIRSRMSS